MVADEEILRIHSTLNACPEFDHPGQFKDFVCTDIRRIFPHRIAVCGLGEFRTRRILRLTNIDFPSDYLQRVIRPDQLILSRPLNKWMATQVPILIDVDELAGDNASPWHSAARDNKIKNVACHGVIDVSGSTFTYFEFGDLGPEAYSDYRRLLTLIVPHLHVILVRLWTRRHLQSIPSPSERRSAESWYETEPLGQRLTRTDVTERELQILNWVAAGKSNWEIGKILNISEFTVKNHVQNLLKKLVVSSRMQAVSKAISVGLINDRANTAH